MSELMDCQLCGSKAWYVSDIIHELSRDTTNAPWEQVMCYCGVRSPEAKWNSSNRVKPGESFLKFREEQRVKHRPKAAKSWNNMQKLLARGLILDKPIKNKGKRL